MVNIITQFAMAARKQSFFAEEFNFFQHLSLIENIEPDQRFPADDQQSVLSNYASENNCIDTENQQKSSIGSKNVLKSKKIKKPTKIIPHKQTVNKIILNFQSQSKKQITIITNGSSKQNKACKCCGAVVKNRHFCPHSKCCGNLCRRKLSQNTERQWRRERQMKRKQQQRARSMKKLSQQKQ